MVEKKIKVIFAGAELSPLAKVGGLADVLGSLPKALIKIGVDVSIFLPFYSFLAKKVKTKLVKKSLLVEIDGEGVKFDVYQTYLPKSKVKIFLVKHNLFSGKDVYLPVQKKLGKNKKELGNVERFAFFSKAVVAAIRELKMKPDVVHCHDWHTALVPTFIDEYSLKYDNFDNVKSLYTIHNLANQGIVGLDILDYVSLSRDLTPAIMEDYYDQDGEVIDLMKIGILSADFINTVSPNYAQEILGKEYGAGMEEYLQRRKKHLSGILNGIDVEFFDPQKDKHIKKRYGVKNFTAGKEVNKEDLQKISKLPKKDVPLFGIVTRLVNQKGLDILRDSLIDLLPRYDFQLVVLGTGSLEIEKSFKDLEKKYPQKVRSNILFDASLAQKIYAGSDFFLMPSRFEPCGLGQMIAMRYGSIPLVRETGGLKDTVKDKKTGFTFKNYKQKELQNSLEKAIKFYANKSQKNKMITRIMQEDFSWEKSARAYLQLYKKLS